MAAVFFILFCFGLPVLVRLLMAMYTPKAYDAVLAEEERRRQRRNGALKTGLGLAAQFLKK